ncbi:hypothetical protein [Streptomyces mordarskii]|uniref:Uncharacterized protein n=1 Tax=Streptomyces mordarskii TaxID=1226758 RepID=A0ABN1BUT8_9ACTN
MLPVDVGGSGNLVLAAHDGVVLPTDVGVFPVLVIDADPKSGSLPADVGVFSDRSEGRSLGAPVSPPT